MYIKHGGGYEAYFDVMSIFVFAFISSFLFYMYSQKDVYTDWRRRLFLFPLFMAGSMGFAVNNSRAVIEGLFKRKSDFVRTPKYSIKEKGDSWLDKKYVPIGVISSLYYLEIAAVPFQLLFLIGFGFVSYLSIQQALQARRLNAQRLLHTETVAARA
jgi:MFS-type transporter involved in bile tolerance (Atg22 family)